MYRQSGLFTIAIAVSACAHASSTAGSAAVNRNPCVAAGECSVEVTLPLDVAGQVGRYAIFKAYAGCPRMLGFQDNTATNIGTGTSMVRGNSSMRAAVPITETSYTTVVLPSMQGRIATIAVFFGAEPMKYVTADFSRSPSQRVRFGFLLESRGIVDDKVVDAQNRSSDRRNCG